MVPPGSFLSLLVCFRQIIEMAKRFDTMCQLFFLWVVERTFYGAFGT